MRVTRGAKSLSAYCTELGVPLSEATIYRLIKVNAIPFKRLSRSILVFDLNAIDRWLSADFEEKLS